MTLTPWPARGTSPWDTITTLKGYIDDRDAALQTEIDAIGPSEGAYFRPETYGAVGDGTTDDTDAFLDCIAAALPVNGAILLSAKTYAISDELQMCGVGTAVTLVGQGSEASVIKALTADAGISWSTVPTGTGSTGVTLFGRPGLSHDWMFDGNTVATQGVLVGLVGYGTWANVHVKRVDGDGWLVFPQNCLFINCISYDCDGNGWTLDYGIQACEFLGCHGHGNDGWDFQIRQSGGPGWGNSAQPQSLRFISGISEQSGAPSFPGAGLGGVHIREGLDITFERFELVSDGTEGSLVLTPSTANGFVGRVVVRDCRVNKIYLDANSGGVAQSFGGTAEPLLLTGWNNIVELVNGSTNYVYDDGGLGSLTTYTPEGTGAATFLYLVSRAKTALDPLWAGFNSAGVGLALIDKDGTMIARYGQTSQVKFGDVTGVNVPGVAWFTDTFMQRDAAASLLTNKITHQAAATTQTPVVSKGAASQSANLIEAQDSAGTVLAGVDAGGKLITPSLEWQPSHNNLKAANAPPSQMTTQVIGPTGFYFLDRVWIPAGVAITNLHMFVQTAGSGLTYAAAAVYESNGTQAGVTGSQTAVWNSAGHKSMALGSPVAAQTAGRFVWVAHAWAGTTGPTMGLLSFVAGTADAGGISPIANGYIVGASPLPASVTMGSLTAYVPFWVGVS